MPPLHLYNTLTKRTDVFTPLKPGLASIYSCGPTVYDYAHIGNLRSYIFADILHRTLAYNRYQVTHVINITDVGHLSGDGDIGEDKMSKGLKREGLPFSLDGMKTLAETYEAAFKENLHDLNIITPNVLPRASEHIPEQIALIQTLEAKGFVYKTSDGMYFDTHKDTAYGKLGGLTPLTDTEARIDTSDKRNPRDFALWKFNPHLGWESPWGTGFPGWHIECSAMSQKYLGETFDIHTGGIDHIPVHHNNEIAQSECAYNKPLAHVWMHNEFVNVDSGKMAKSEGNFITLKTLAEHSIHPLSYRYWLLTSHYRTPITFSYEAVQAAQQAFERLLVYIHENKKPSATPPLNALEHIRTVLNTDLNTPQVLALLYAIQNDTSIAKAETVALFLELDAVLGLSLDILSDEIGRIPDEISSRIQARETLKKAGSWSEADAIRDELSAHGYTIKDNPHTTPTVTRSLASLTEV